MTIFFTLALTPVMLLVSRLDLVVEVTRQTASHVAGLSPEAGSGPSYKPTISKLRLDSQQDPFKASNLVSI